MILVTNRCQISTVPSLLSSVFLSIDSTLFLDPQTIEQQWSIEKWCLPCSSCYVGISIRSPGLLLWSIICVINYLLKATYNVIFVTELFVLSTVLHLKALVFSSGSDLKPYQMQHVVIVTRSFVNCYWRLGWLHGGNRERFSVVDHLRYILLVLNYHNIEDWDWAQSRVFHSSLFF